MFCTKCGQKLADEAAYCSACGAIVEKSVAADQGSRKQVYVGEIKKCPNCGEALSAFEIKCHSCGYELRNIKASSAIQEFYEKITQLEAQRNERKEGETEKSIANVIRNFPVPNTKEDVLEFMMLAASNIDASLYSIQGDRRNSKEYQSQKTINDAWYATAEQIYHKAELSFGDDPAFSKIQKIYVDKIKHISTEKRKGALSAFFSGITSIFKRIASSIHKDSSIGFYIICGLLPLLFFGGTAIKHQQREHRLEAVVVEIQDCIANEDYDTAYIKAQGLYMDDGWSSESTKRWDKVRNELITLIETKSGVSYTMEQEREDSTKNTSTDAKGTVSSTIDDGLNTISEGFDTIINGFENIFN